MKKIVVPAVIVILILLALPLLTGTLTESHVRQRLSAMSDGSPLTAEITEYERGWFASSAKVDLRLADRYVARLQPNAAPPGADFLSQRLPVLVEIRHGPIMLGDGIALGTSRVVARSDPAAPESAAVHERFGVPYLFELRGRAGFGGGFDFDADVPPFDYAEGTSEVAFTGLRVEGVLDGDRVVARGETAALDYESAFAGASFEDVRISADYELGAERLALGTTGVEVGRIVVSTALLGPLPLLDAEALRITSSTELDETASAARVGLESSARSIAAGAGFRLTDMDIGILLASLDPQALRDYYAQLKRAADPSAAGQGGGVDDLQPVLVRLLEGGPTLTLEPARFALDGEPFSASVLVTTDPAALPAGADLTDPAPWLAVATVEADVRIAKGLAQRAAEAFARNQLASLGDGEPASDLELDSLAQAQAAFVLVTLVSQGYLVDAGDAYEAALRYARGSLTVNGLEVPIPLR